MCWKEVLNILPVIIIIRLNYLCEIAMLETIKLYKQLINNELDKSNG